LVLIKDDVYSKRQSIARNQQKTLNFISTQWPNYIAGGNEAQSSYEINFRKLIASAIFVLKNIMLFYTKNKMSI